MSGFEPLVFNPDGQSPVLLVCEHASAQMPDAFDGLGLDAETLKSHIAWDPGAYDTARNMAKLLDAPLVHSSVSRLIYDCNRAPGAPGAVPVRSEATDIPGNQALSAAGYNARVEAYYLPFERLLVETLEARDRPTVLVTIHSFTPVYLGKSREVEIGILHDIDARLADTLMAIEQPHIVRRNEPYGPEDGVMHTLRRHALPRGIPNVMIEVRNDLLDSPAACASMAETLTRWLSKGLADMGQASGQAVSI